MPRFRRPLLTAACTVALSVVGPTATATATGASTPTHLSGALADGATWIADLPAQWNGTLLLFSHGFGPPVAADAPGPVAQAELLKEGYALAGSSYDPHGSWWALNSAEQDQFQTIDAFRHRLGDPTRVISVGQSMGGLVNAQIARDAAGRVNAALNLCGLVGGGVDLSNYQLDAEYTLATFFDPADAGRLVSLTSPAEGAAVATRLTDAVEAAQKTAAGRARIALADAYLNLADWAPGQNPPAAHDYTGQEVQQYDWIAGGLLSFIMPARWFIEDSVGGNVSWNAGVDYARLLGKSPHATQVRALYRTAGLNLRADLERLTQGARVTADPAALARLRISSTAGQGLAVPLLDLHTIADQLVPVEQESAFAQRVRTAGQGALLRQAYVARQGHCNFTTAEIVSGLHAVEHRLDTGHWDDSTSAADLRRSAERLRLDGAAFVDYRPARLSGVR